MRKSEKHEDYEDHQKREQFLLFLCFLTSALIGYFLTNHVALLGA